MSQISRLPVREVMRKDLATLSPDDTVQAAIDLFEDLRIGGAPVVDGGGKLVGVLTLFDVAQTDRVREPDAESSGDFDMIEPADETRFDESDPDEIVGLKEDYSPAVAGRVLVSDWMTREVVTVPPAATLAKVCRLMVDRHIHRVFVAEDGKLLGVVSSFDVVRCVAGTPRIRA
jgi:CBS domain-containing protein